MTNNMKGKIPFVSCNRDFLISPSLNLILGRREGESDLDYEQRMLTRIGGMTEPEWQYHRVCIVST